MKLFQKLSAAFVFILALMFLSLPAHAIDWSGLGDTTLQSADTVIIRRSAGSYFTATPDDFAVWVATQGSDRELLFNSGGTLTGDTGLSYSSTGTLIVTGLTVGGSTVSGTNTGDQTITLTGDVTGSGTGSFAATIAAGVVSYSNIQNISATDKILGRVTAGAGVIEEIACDTICRGLLDDTTTSAQRTTLGLAIGSDVQAWAAALDSVSGTNTGDEVAATTSVSGVSELATTAETDAGTDTGRTVTPDGLAGSYAGTKIITLSTGLITTNAAVGNSRAIFVVPPSMNGMNLVGVHGVTGAAGTTGTMDVQVRNVTDTTDMLSTKLIWASGATVDNGGVVIDTALDDVVTDDVIVIDIDVIHTTAAKRPRVTLEFRLP